MLCLLDVFANCRLQIWWPKSAMNSFGFCSPSPSFLSHVFCCAGWFCRIFYDRVVAMFFIGSHFHRFFPVFVLNFVWDLPLTLVLTAFLFCSPCVIQHCSSLLSHVRIDSLPLAYLFCLYSTFQLVFSFDLNPWFICFCNSTRACFGVPRFRDRLPIRFACGLRYQLGLEGIQMFKMLDFVDFNWNRFYRSEKCWIKLLMVFKYLNSYQSKTGHGDIWTAKVETQCRSEFVLFWRFPRSLLEHAREHLVCAIAIGEQRQRIEKLKKLSTCACSVQGCRWRPLTRWKCRSELISSYTHAHDIDTKWPWNNWSDPLLIITTFSFASSSPLVLLNQLFPSLPSNHFRSCLAFKSWAKNRSPDRRKKFSTSFASLVRLERTNRQTCPLNSFYNFLPTNFTINKIFPSLECRRRIVRFGVQSLAQGIRPSVGHQTSACWKWPWYAQFSIRFRPIRLAIGLSLHPLIHICP